jgi:hypothetical protein
MWSIVGTSAVKHSPKAANPQAARKAIGRVSGSHARRRPHEADRGEAREDEGHDQHVDRRQQGSPEDLAPDDVPQSHLGRQLALPGALVSHPDEGGEERLEDGRHERRVGQEPRRDVGGVVHGAASPVERADVSPEAQPECEEHRHRLAHRRQERGVPVVDVHAQVAEHDDAALPLERRGEPPRVGRRAGGGGLEGGHGSSASLRKRSSSVGLRTS